jgi:hypothetical protein
LPIDFGDAGSSAASRSYTLSHYCICSAIAPTFCAPAHGVIMLASSRRRCSTPSSDRTSREGAIEGAILAAQAAEQM